MEYVFRELQWLPTFPRTGYEFIEDILRRKATFATFKTRHIASHLNLTASDELTVGRVRDACCQCFVEGGTWAFRSTEKVFRSTEERGLFVVLRSETASSLCAFVHFNFSRCACDYFVSQAVMADERAHALVTPSTSFEATFYHIFFPTALKSQNWDATVS